jgi:hypothetical protein
MAMNAMASDKYESMEPKQARNMLQVFFASPMGLKAHILGLICVVITGWIFCVPNPEDNTEYHVISATSSCLRRLKDHMLDFFFLPQADPCSPRPAVRVDDNRPTFIGENSASNRSADL